MEREFFPMIPRVVTGGLQVARVQLSGVTKKFGAVTAVNEITLEIPDKQFTVLVGPSGCGKTTALRLIAGLEEATAGDIFIGERRVNDVPPKDRDIAMVFQNYALYPHMTVYDNMAFGLRLRKYPKTEIDRRVKEAAEMLGIGMLLDRKPKQLSGGQRQRGTGPGHRARAPGLPDGRTAEQPRRKTARADAGRDQEAARPAADHHDLCHPRPGRGDDDGGPDCGDERWARATGRHAAQPL